MVRPIHVKAATNISATAWTVLMTEMPGGNRNAAR
jgi:hypothetical protein